MFVFRITLKSSNKTKPHKIRILCRAEKLMSKVYIFWGKQNKHVLFKNTNSTKYLNTRIKQKKSPTHAEV